MSKTLEEIKVKLGIIAAETKDLEQSILAYREELEAEVDEDAEEQDEDLASKIEDARNAGDSCDDIDANLDDLYSYLGIPRPA